MTTKATIGTGEIGPVAQSLQGRFERVVRGDDPEFADWLMTA